MCIICVSIDMYNNITFKDAAGAYEELEGVLEESHKKVVKQKITELLNAESGTDTSNPTKGRNL